MQKQPTLMGLPLFFFFIIFFLSSLNGSVAGTSQSSTSSLAAQNPFTAKASLIRYWNKQITNNLPKPSFLLSKASPLNAVDSSLFTKLATDKNALSSRLQSFCSSANLFCYPDIAPSLEKHDSSVDFSSYEYKNFTNYGTSQLGGTDSFKNYSGVFDNMPVNSFRRYSRDSNGHNDKFSTYAPNANVPDESFNTYGSGATGGSGEFKHYNDESVNVPTLTFTTYETNANGRKQGFSSYTTNSNAGSETFASYGKKGNGVPTTFTSYGNETNVVVSTFASYGQSGNGANDSFTSYGDNGNVPTNNFRSYGDGGNAATDSFSSYRDQSNVGDDSFQSYAKGSGSGKVDFTNYGNSFNEGTDTFKGYGKGSVGKIIGFKTYGVNNTFKDYSKKGITFAGYRNTTSESSESKVRIASKWVEPGKFFRESMLKEGTVMPMPDIRDKMPKRSFLPRSIVSKLPFSTSQISELKEIFHAEENSSMATILQNTIEECERKPSRGETKRCVGSVEDMIDFAVSVLGHNVVVRSTENVEGSKEDVMIGTVKGINGGRVTQSVSCHQSLFPYMVYYCHSVPKVRVYEADLLDPKTKSKINHGVAICHIDTSAWSPTHGAFLALGSEPGLIEVCHWIFENDMTWATAD
ncbi:polygalacturonase 1 beta-like protein 3 [Macadamia integrifolia]|uniref:polygalacturonase 1 beta-like protein 3 n=1 Tax=Macadamia integrifolia TaxID=60698 RepID=UPI001C4EA13F|nr:polygalacturonase 1 beta-like protein 3 [Macadamia integrifolia]